MHPMMAKHPMMEKLLVAKMIAKHPMAKMMAEHLMAKKMTRLKMMAKMMAKHLMMATLPMRWHCLPKQLPQPLKWFLQVTHQRQRKRPMEKNQSIQVIDKMKNQLCQTLRRTRGSQSSHLTRKPSSSTLKAAWF